MRYRDSGVDIDKANQATKFIKKAIGRTWGSEVLSDVGHFGGLFRMVDGYKEPVLVSSMDGVGTKLLVASMAGNYATVGQDLVNHCVDDILVQGALPLFFLDYVATGKIEPEMVASLVGGLAQACEENGCALIGGETAEMPGIYHGDDFDLAGSIVGVVDRENIIDGKSITPGDRIFALPSNGLHTNGYSLVRRVIFDKLGHDIATHVSEFGATVGDELLRVHRSYLHPVRELQKSVEIRGLAHITGGGILENLPRVLPAGCGAAIQRSVCPILPVFSFLQDAGDIDEVEMYRVFNMGMGMLIIVSKEDADRVPDKLVGLNVYEVGEIIPGDQAVELV